MPNAHSINDNKLFENVNMIEHQPNEIKIHVDFVWNENSRIDALNHENII